MSYYDPIWQRVWTLNDRVTTVENGLRDLKYEVEKRQMRRDKRGLCTELMAFLKEVMTPHQWAIVLFLTLASAAGIISPKQIVDHFLMQGGESERR